MTGGVHIKTDKTRGALHWGATISATTTSVTARQCQPQPKTISATATRKIHVCHRPHRSQNIRMSLLRSKTISSVFHLHNTSATVNCQFIWMAFAFGMSATQPIFLDSNNLTPTTQSAYRQFYSTETAVTKMYNDLLLAADSGYVSALCLLDLTAAFDTVDHDLLTLRLERQFGLRGIVLQWFRSYQFCLTDLIKSSTATIRHQQFTLRARYHKARYLARVSSSRTRQI